MPDAPLAQAAGPIAAAPPAAPDPSPSAAEASSAAAVPAAASGSAPSSTTAPAASGSTTAPATSGSTTAPAASATTPGGQAPVAPAPAANAPASVGPVATAPAGPAALHALLAHPLAKAALPAPAFLVLAPLIFLIFRKTWARIDLEARRERAATVVEGAFDARPAVAAFVAAFGLTLLEYYGGAGIYFTHLHPRLVAYAERHPGLRPALFADLYNYVYWASSRLFVYAVLPLAVWKAAFPRDSLLDMGLRPRGLREHGWLYAASLALVVPCVLFVASQPDFGAYYPFYRQASRSWLDFAAWETLYAAQFVGLEIFFRGWWLAVMRRAMGSAAIFSMVVPYCMIHYGKPYLEANGAVLAGVVLGTLAMKTRSIYAGLAVHVAVALGMDIAVLAFRGGLPRAWVPW